MSARGLAAAALLALLAPLARAELAAQSPHGFLASFQRSVDATPSQAFDAVAQLPRWWNVAHSYSGQSAQLRFALRAGDCFCEQWDGGSVEHARVVLVRTGSLVRLEGALGPLQDLAVRGVLTFATGVAQGRTFVRLTYRVSGAPEAGLERLAPAVDRMMGDVFERWAAFADAQR
jgi:hypothetical protein